jgi:putative DNA primase/helicase
MKNKNSRRGGNAAGAVKLVDQQKDNTSPLLKFQQRIGTRSANVPARLPVFQGNFTLPEAAVLYAKHGVPVLPLHGIRNGRCTCRTFCGEAAGGHPRVPGSFRVATTNLPQIRKWWRAWPDANIGIAAGAASGLAVVTVQCDLGAAPLNWLVAHFGPLPRVPTAKTPHGLSFYFRYCGELSSALPDNIEIHAAASFAIAPPSRHVSGHRYEWCLHGA